MTAIFGGANKEYRYLLVRELNLAIEASLTFIMLNPSTADEVNNDPTIRRCIGFATRWGFNRLYVVNLYSLRATDPKQLLQAPDPVGPDNDRYISMAFGGSDLVIAGWGGNLPKSGAERIKKVQELAKKAERRIYCLKVNNDGNPGHPLYLAGDAIPKEWRVMGK